MTQQEQYPLRGLRMHYNASPATGTRLLHPEHATPNGICVDCVQCGICEVGRKAKTGQALFPQPFGKTQFGAEKRLPGIKDLQVVPELFGPDILFHEVKTETRIGGFRSRAPVSIAAMGSTQVAHSKGKALSEGAARAGIPVVIGENVLITHGPEGLEERIRAFKENQDDGYGAVVVQANVHDRKLGVWKHAVEYGADAVEVKLGQGAKQGLGGEIRFESAEEAEKYSKAGYTIIKNPDGSWQRHAHPGEVSEESVRQALAEAADTGLPVWVKTGAGKGVARLVELLERIKKEEKIRLECLTVDGHGGGTGMSPWLVMNEENVPSAAALARMPKTSFDVLVAGGYSDGMDIAKAMMLGAKGVSMGRPFLIAAGTAGAEGVENFVKAVSTELKMACATLKAEDVAGIIGKKENLVALSRLAGEWFGVKTTPVL